MSTALFTNFSTEEFIGHWDGKPRKFAPGESLYMPDYLAKHFAKHLTNRELIKVGKERDTSPKVKINADGSRHIENTSYNEMFAKAYTPDLVTEKPQGKKEDVDSLIAVANKNRQAPASASLEDDDAPAPAEFTPNNSGDDSFENKPVE